MPYSRRPVLIFAWLVLATPTPAQQSIPVGVFRGHFVSFSGTSVGGEVTVEQAGGDRYTCTYDAHSLFLRDQSPVHVDALRLGDPVEIVSDRKIGRVCYTRMLSVTFQVPPQAHRSPPRHLQNVPPKGYLTFSGMVVRSDAAAMTVKTQAGEKTFILRSDTRFSADGVKMDTPTPLVNKHVFVRAGRGLSGMLEAYQVMWGEILFAPAPSSY